MLAAFQVGNLDDNPLKLWIPRDDLGHKALPPRSVMTDAEAKPLHQQARLAYSGKMLLGLVSTFM